MEDYIRKARDWSEVVLQRAEDVLNANPQFSSVSINGQVFARDITGGPAYPMPIPQPPQLGIITYTGLCELVEQGVIEGVQPGSINPSSINVTLQGEFLIEQNLANSKISFANREAPVMHSFKGVCNLAPDAFCLAAIQEKLNLPNDICASVVLRSSAARFGLDHAYAGFADPGYSGHLTLELKNFLRFHHIQLAAGDQIAQLIFQRVQAVPEGRCYASRGNKYGGDTGPTQIKQEHGL